MPTIRRYAPAAIAVLALALAGCTSSDRNDPADAREPSASASPEALVALAAAPTDPVVLDEDDAGVLAASSAGTFFESAPVAVLADDGQVLPAASAAVALGVPVVLDGPDAAAALEDLGTEVVLAVGEVADPGTEVVLAGPAELAELLGGSAPTPVEAGEETAAVAGLSAGGSDLLAAAGPDPDGPTGSPTAEPTETATTEPTTDGASSGSATAGSAGPTSEDGSEDATDGVTAAPPAQATRDELPETAPAEPAAEQVLVVTTGAPRDAAAVANARAAGAEVLVVEEGDPRATAESVAAVAAAEPAVVVGLGAEVGDAETLDWRTATAATGVELPGGGQLALPGKTYVALYGNPTTSALGVLGEQGPEATIDRAVEHAEPYEPLTDTTVVPALEIISTVASAGAGDDGNYSAERPIEELRPLVDLAAEHGLYVILDLQPGRTDFVTQAELYEELLLEPHVGLALDPEWRLEPGEVHLRQIGQVDVAEVNEVVTWLADLTRENALPQKILILHQFQVRMIPGVDEVDQSRSELAVLIHVDGQGAQNAKQDTWRVLRQNAPSVPWWGWKNFYDEDTPAMLTPEQTMQVEPTPHFISYQ